MAEAVVGWNTALALRTEATYGTDPTTGSVFLEFITESVEKTFETMAQVDTRTPNERNMKSQGREKVAGGFDVYVNSENIGHLLFYILGNAAAPVIIGAGPGYTHVLKPTTTATKSFTYEADYGEVAAKSKKARGCKINSLSIDISDGLVTASGTLAGQTMDEDATPTTVTFATYPRTFDFKDFTFSLLGTDETVDVMGGSINFKRANIEDDYRQGNKQIQSIPTGALSAEISLTLVYDPAMAAGSQDALDGTTADGTVILTYTGDLISGTDFHKMTLTFPNCYVEGGSPTTAAGGKVQREVRIRALHGYGSNEELVNATLINTKSTVYA